MVCTCSNYCLLPLFELSVPLMSRLMACSHGGGGPREGEVPHLPEVRKTWPSHAAPGCWVRFKMLSSGR